MLIKAQYGGWCDHCGGRIETEDLVMWQPGGPSFRGLLMHRVCPGDENDPPQTLGAAMWDTVERVEMRGLPSDKPVPYVLTADGRALLRWT